MSYYIYGYIETILFPHIYFPVEPPLISSWISNEGSLASNSLESAVLYGKKILYNRYISAKFCPKNTLSLFLFLDIEYDGGAIITFWPKQLGGKNKEKDLHCIVLTFLVPSLKVRKPLLAWLLISIVDHSGHFDHLYAVIY